MPQTSFADLAREHPELRSALSRIGAWLDEHTGTNMVDPRTLARQIQGVSSGDLARSLLILAAAGFLVRVYKVVTPSGVFAEGDYADPTRVPDRVEDRFHNKFETAESDIVPVFRLQR